MIVWMSYPLLYFLICILGPITTASLRRISACIMRLELNGFESIVYRWCFSITHLVIVWSHLLFRALGWLIQSLLWVLSLHDLVFAHLMAHVRIALILHVIVKLIWLLTDQVHYLSSTRVESRLRSLAYLGSQISARILILASRIFWIHKS